MSCAARRSDPIRLNGRFGGSETKRVAVEIGKRRRQRRHRRAGFGRPCHDTPKRRVCLLHQGNESRRHQQVGGCGPSAECFCHRIQQLRTDDAAGPPDLGDDRHRQVPVEFFRRAAHHREALGIGGDRAGKQRQLEIPNRASLSPEILPTPRPQDFSATSRSSLIDDSTRAATAPSEPDRPSLRQLPQPCRWRPLWLGVERWERAECPGEWSARMLSALKVAGCRADSGDC